MAEILEVLQGIDVLRDVDAALLAGVAPSCELVRVGRGTRLFRDGDVADCAWFLITGRAAEVVDGRCVAEVGPGELIGEMTLLVHPVRSVTAVAARDCTLVRMDRPAFLDLVRQAPGLPAALARVVGRRLHRLEHGLVDASRPRTLAVLPLGNPDPAHHFCLELGRTLRGTTGNICILAGRGMFVSGRVLETGLDPARPDTPEALAWLDQVESRFDSVVYLCEPGLTPWTSRCLRQADKLILLGEGGEPCPPGPAEAFWRDLADVNREEHLKVVLVLLHEQPFRAGATAAWLEGREVRRVHHVRLGHPEDMRRLTRCLARQGVTLVLGGGGARGFVHIGVLKALEERGLPVDLVGGTSMGAFVGAQVAMGLTSAEIHVNCRRMFVESGSVFDFTLPMFFLIRGRRVRRHLERLFGDLRLEDLPHPFYCTTTDLTVARQAVHERGPLVPWLGASMSMPGVGPPLVVDGRMHVDGGVLDNVPVGPARRKPVGPLVAVNAESDSRLPALKDPYDIPMWRLVLERLSPFHPSPVPDLLQVMARMATMGSTELKGELKPDLEIHPPLGPYRVFDFRRIDEIVALGYETARRALDEGGEVVWRPPAQEKVAR